ncbi:MAG TPA: hypothetical protein VFE98_06435 [Candidatus Bathyarchaeia archaeon]|nr:hypothetical protein [Candidatus Bathyarchaeia archaeon]
MTVVLQWGRYDLGGKRIFIPSPLTFTSFYTGLHEIGHIMSEHHAWDGKPEYLWEYEAFSWAVRFCREKKIKFPVKTASYERSIIAEKVREHIKRGGKKIDKTVIAFTKEGGDDDPDVVYVKKNISDDGIPLQVSG